MNRLKFSIVTPSFNQGKYIRKTIESVIDQNYENFEHIIIDGGSTDETLEILKNYPHLKWISEKDRGQANAINKGFDLASGEIYAWLNSDDYYDNNTFRVVEEKFQNEKDSQFVYGDIVYVDEQSNYLSQRTGNNLSYEGLVENPDIIRQPSCFWKKELWNRCGPLDENYFLVMDLDLFLRFGKETDFYYCNNNLSFYRTYPQTKTLSNLKKQVKEIYRTVKKYEGRIPFQLKKKLLRRYFGI